MGFWPKLANMYHLATTARDTCSLHCLHSTGKANVFTVSVGTFYSKDPLAPKKPANAFMMFCQTMRQEEFLTKEQEGAGADLSHQELTRQLAQKWNYLGADEKEVALNSTLTKL